MTSHKKLPPWLSQAIKQQADISWHKILQEACMQLPQDYLEFLTTQDWLPGKDKILNAFHLPLDKTQYILYGESPYPRAQSAIGFAFWDGAVKEIWSEKGLSKTVNRATSLRNMMKMLISLETKPIASRVETLDQLFQNLLAHGFLLLNFNLSLSSLAKNKEAKYWIPFHQTLLQQIAESKQHKQLPKLVLFGKIAELVLKIPASENFDRLVTEHPYNLSFINNPKVLEFFAPLQLLSLKLLQP